MIIIIDTLGTPVCNCCGRVVCKPDTDWCLCPNECACYMVDGDPKDDSPPEAE